MAGFPEKFIDGEEARARADALDADVAEPWRQMSEEPRLQVGRRGKIGMTALGWKREVPRAIPDKKGLTQPGPRPDDRDRAAGDRLARVEGMQFARLEHNGREGNRFEIVEEVNGRDADLLGELGFAEMPGAAGDQGAAGFDRPGHGDAGSLDSDVSPRQELAEDRSKRYIPGRGKHGLAERRPRASRGGEKGQRRLGSPDVPREQQATCEEAECPPAGRVVFDETVISIQCSPVFLLDPPTRTGEPPVEVVGRADQRRGG